MLSCARLPIMLAIVCLWTLSACSTVSRVSGGILGSDNQNAEDSESVSTTSAGDPLVYRIQEQLKVLGYYSGPVNGDLSTRTQASIQDFQLDTGIPIDGKATSELLEKLSEKTATVREAN